MMANATVLRLAWHQVQLGPTARPYWSKIAEVRKAQINNKRYPIWTNVESTRNTLEDYKADAKYDQELIGTQKKATSATLAIIPYE